MENVLWMTQKMAARIQPLLLEIQQQGIGDGRLARLCQVDPTTIRQWRSKKIRLGT